MPAAREKGAVDELKQDGEELFTLGDLPEE